MFSKTAISAVAALSLIAGGLVSGIQPAMADEVPSLTYDQLVLTPEYSNMMDAAKRSSDYLLTSNDVQQSIVTTTSYGSISFENDVDINANQTDAMASYSIKSGDPRDSLYFNYYYLGGHYLTAIDGFQTGTTPVKNLKTVLARVGKPNAAFVDSQNTLASDLVDIKPSVMFSQIQQTTIAQVLALSPDVKFSHISEVYAGNGAGYDFSATAPLPTGGTATITVTQVYDITLSTATLVETSTSGVSVTETLNQTINQGFNLINLSDDAVVSQSALVNMGHKVEAEKSVTPKANSIASTAKAIAKASKKPVDASHLTSAAKALKAKVSKVKNGVKLTAKSGFISGSMCVTAVKGKVSVAHC